MTDVELRDAAVSELKKTTVGYVNKNWKTPPPGSRWANALNLLAQIGETAPETFPTFGISVGQDMAKWGTANIQRALADMASLGAKYVRQDFPWSEIEPTEGTFNWTGYDTIIQESLRVGLTPIPILGYTPAWANGGHADRGYAPTDPVKFGSFCGSAAAHLIPLGVRVFEIWNEPNIPQYWKPGADPVKYTACLKTAYQAIKAVDTNVTVVTGGTSPAGNSVTSLDPPTWLTKLYANGAKGYFDAVGNHPYIDDDGFIWSWLKSLNSIMTANGDGGKRVWATEVGCSPVKVGGDAEVVNRMTARFADWKSLPYAGVLCWFTYWDPNVYGMVDGNWNPRPPYQAYKQAV